LTWVNTWALLGDTLMVPFQRSHTMYERILIATDGTALSTKAVTAGIELAAQLDAEVFAYMAVARYPQAYFEGAVVLSPTEVAKIEKDWHNQAQMVVDEVQKQAHARDVKATTVVGHGPIAESIIAAAKKHKCGLIVMASHGRKGLQRVLLGSETLDVLTHSHVPVLVLR
jgi:nucleotide-binding universal stress UspA family protein